MFSAVYCCHFSKLKFTTVCYVKTIGYCNHLDTLCSQLPRPKGTFEKFCNLISNSKYTPSFFNNSDHYNEENYVQSLAPNT